MCYARRLPALLHQHLLEVFFGDVAISLPHADLVGRSEHCGDRGVSWRGELVAGQLELKAVGIPEVQRVHEAPIDSTGVGVASHLQTLDRSLEDLRGDRV